jgi:hypothetical protein
MNPMSEIGQRKYSSLTQLERDELESYVLKAFGSTLGTKINKSMDNIGSKKKTLTVVSVFNRAEEYHRRQREDDV